MNIDDMSLKEIVENCGEYDLLEEIGIPMVVSYFDQDDLLTAMDFDPELCFESEIDMMDYIMFEDKLRKQIANSFDTMNDQEVFDRANELLMKNRIPYDIWDKFLREYE